MCYGVFISVFLIARENCDKAAVLLYKRCREFTHVIGGKVWLIDYYFIGYIPVIVGDYAEHIIFGLGKLYFKLLIFSEKPFYGCGGLENLG